MATNASKLPEHVVEVAVEARAAPPSDDPLVASLRGFGPLGVLAILVILARVT